MHNQLSCFYFGLIVGGLPTGHSTLNERTPHAQNTYKHNLNVHWTSSGRTLMVQCIVGTRFLNKSFKEYFLFK